MSAKITGYWEAASAIIPEEQKEQIGKALINLLKSGWGSIEITARNRHLLDVRMTEIEPFKKFGESNEE